MALLQLKDIGKIYVSEGNVAVGIRGVNLTFDSGEFVAVTGQSGSGKSTLLNIISGMDTYEEGEMYVEGHPTSHYMQPDWEEFRKKYISFIFQDYNIIDSFTVLQNVELALMHIEDKKQRRSRALELIERVGLTSHLRQKGSKLSGGQKQRTVIARALAKDSPIILADEPTGNLDSATSAEIIELLREVSEDKLLIVVTHNFEEVEACATRHIRIFDGAVESDTVLVSTAKKQSGEASAAVIRAPLSRKKDIKNGITLGRSIFTSRPRLSVFLCLLMIVGTVGVFFVTSLCGEASALFEKKRMFTPIDGRVVLTRQDGTVPSEEEIKKISEEYGVDDIVRYDILLDTDSFVRYTIDGVDKYFSFDPSFGDDFGDDIIGSYPQKAGEVLLSVPISYKQYFDGDDLGYLNMSSYRLKVTGIHYYIDNNITPKCVFSREGFELATAVHYMTNNGSTINLLVQNSRGTVYSQDMYGAYVSHEVEDGKIYVDDSQFLYLGSQSGAQASVNISTDYYNYNYYVSTGGNRKHFSRSFGMTDITNDRPENLSIDLPHHTVQSYKIAISPYALYDMANEVLKDSYKQVSLFFENEDEAREAIEGLNQSGYIAVSSKETYVPDAMTVLGEMIESAMYAVIWVLAILFLAFFIYLCSSRTLTAFKSDMAIMRSMGISVRQIRVGMYVRMLIALIPAYICVILTAIMIFTVPTFNGFFTYLYAWQYVMIFIGMLLLTLRVTQMQIKKLFSKSVKKALKGGSTND